MTVSDQIIAVIEALCKFTDIVTSGSEAIPKPSRQLCAGCVQMILSVTSTF